MSESSPFIPFTNFVVLEALSSPVPTVAEDSKPDATGNEEKPDGRARQPWARVLSVGPDCKAVKEGQTVFFFYAEEVEYEGIKMLLARESDLYCALK